jgi:hypothetical protein
LIAMKREDSQYEALAELLTCGRARAAHQSDCDQAEEGLTAAG